MTEKREPVTRTLYAAGARWNRSVRPYYCTECGERLFPLSMTPHQLDIWERTGLCRDCQQWKGDEE